MKIGRKIGFGVLAMVVVASALLGPTVAWWVQEAARIHAELVTLQSRLETRQQSVSALRTEWDAVPQAVPTPAGLKEKIDQEFTRTREVLFGVRDGNGQTHSRIDGIPSMFRGNIHAEWVDRLKEFEALERSGRELFQGAKAKDADHQLTSLLAKLNTAEKELDDLLREIKAVPQGERPPQALSEKLQGAPLRAELAGMEVNIIRLEIQMALDSLANGPVRQGLVERFRTALPGFKRVADLHGEIQAEIAKHAKSAKSAPPRA